MSLLLFRTDGNTEIGLGHVMRCLSIADSFRARGHVVWFILADDTVEGLVNSRGYESVILGSRFDEMEGEIDYWDHEVLSELDTLIVDSYFVTERYFLSLKEMFRECRLVYVDDLASFPYPIDVLVNYNVYSRRDEYEQLYSNSDDDRVSTRFILGPRYAPLRYMFRNIAHKVQPEDVKNVLISTGGTDELHLSLELVKALCDSEIRNTRAYHFLLGGMNTDIDEIHIISGENPHIVIHQNVSDMKSLICDMDIAVSAAGSTLYEICACGVPVITYAIADNQLLGANGFEELGLAVNIGDLRNVETIDSNRIISGELDSFAVDRIISAIDYLCNDYKRRVDMGEKMQKLIDGFGADRIVEEIFRV